MADTRDRMPGLRTWAEGVALVTGGASGIGAALGRELARRGARRGARRPRRRRRRSRGRSDRRARAGGPRPRRSTCATRPPSLRWWRTSSSATVGSTTCSTTPASPSAARWRDLRLEDWREAVEVNLMGVVHGVQAAWPRHDRAGLRPRRQHRLDGGLPADRDGRALRRDQERRARACRARCGSRAAAHGVRVSVLCPGVDPHADPRRRAATAGLRNFIPTETLDGAQREAAPDGRRRASRARRSTTWRATAPSSSTRPGGACCVSSTGWRPRSWTPSRGGSWRRSGRCGGSRPRCHPEGLRLAESRGIRRPYTRATERGDPC